MPWWQVVLLIVGAAAVVLAVIGAIMGAVIGSLLDGADSVVQHSHPTLPGGDEAYEPLPTRPGEGDE